ncbi:PTS lactose/cellobiose transporter subunit IIA [Clostridium beijerinckii]|uniref:PTS lactose/cellobiose transporter subunit IIA n=1 Tax=Clostridium beijerinckii TaxID=1520 RepID=UPI00098C03F9|nr:PTS lactose/cellobiose transporter subunit IIA [Clostridium beijerinckii]NRT77838.1 PTS system lactose-specific IIA component [Clostridium beijerinckii]OOM39738.1 lactose-specific phosphotransferase enzyme IIA component [Clostridium beijerinckii]
MDKHEMEMVTLEIVAYSGDARTKYMEALNAANNKEYDKAKELILEGNKLIAEAHKVQTKMLQMEASGEKIEVGFLAVHAQDHLMTVVLLRDIINNFIELYKKCN